MSSTAQIQQAQRVRRGFAPEEPTLDQQVRALQKQSTFASIAVLGADWAIMLSAATLSWRVFSAFGATPISLAVYLTAILIVGSRQKGLENLVHEATHFNLSRNRWLNDAIGTYGAALWIAPGLTPAKGRSEHIADHHGHFGDPSRDRDFFGYQKMGLGRLPTTSMKDSLMILISALSRSAWWRLNATLAPLRRITRVAIALVVLGMLFDLSLLVPVILYWVIPFFLIFIPIRFLSQASEHMGLGRATEFETTRNKLGFFQQALLHPHGDGYHLVHHLYPRIPHHRLARAHRLLMRDAAYRRGHHCHGLILPRRGQRSTLSELLLKAPLSPSPIPPSPISMSPHICTPAPPLESPLSPTGPACIPGH
jgi:fatty acid desaturase